MSPRTLVALLAFVAVGAAASPPLPATYLVLALPEGGPVLLEARDVTLTALPAPAAPRRADRTVVELEAGADGSWPREWRVGVETSRRGEFASPTGIDGIRVPHPAPPFVVRILRHEVEGLVVRGESGHELRVDRAAFDAARMLAAPTGEVIVLQRSGSAANRLDLLVVGDGYTVAERDAFLADATNVFHTFTAASPYAEYAGAFNASALFVASAQSGADHPAYRAGCLDGDDSCCPDDDAVGDPRAGQNVDTAFDATYCTAGIFRLLSVDESQVFRAAAAAPDWDAILVIVNDPTYGGAGGFLAVTSMHPQATAIAQHEVGHSFTGLADEYETPYPGFPDCSDTFPMSPPCEVNVTDVTDRSRLKWRGWVRDETPIPTPASSPWLDAVGLFEGARYVSAGKYRPKARCLMRSLGVPFCPVCSAAFVAMLYDGGWGAPADGIDLIEPASERPTPGAVRLAVGGAVEFSVDLLDPGPAAAVDARWSVDGTPAGIGATFSLHTAPCLDHQLVVRLDVADMSPFGDPLATSPLGVTSRSWSVETACTPRVRSRVPAR